MAKSYLTFHLIYLLSSFLILGAHGVSIQAFMDSNFTELLWESKSTAGCNNLPEDKWESVNSIRADVCFIAYGDPNCESGSSEKYLPGDTILTRNQLGSVRYIVSFQICNEEEGGNQLNSDVPPDVLGSYQNVCSCVNVPQNVQNMSRWSFVNHHNDLLAYYEPDCSQNKWNSTLIKAGRNYYSRNMQDHQKTDNVTQKTYKIQSFGPDPNSKDFQISCGSFNVITTETPNTFESTTESVVSRNSENNSQTCQCQNLDSKFIALQTQMDQIKINQEKFQREILQIFQNFTSQLKHDLHELFAKNI